MAKEGLQIVQLREHSGIDLNVDSRVLDPTAWTKLTNLYGKTPGRLYKRPGSELLAEIYVLDSWTYFVAEIYESPWFHFRSLDSSQPEIQHNSPHNLVFNEVDGAPIENAGSSWIKGEDITSLFGEILGLGVVRVSSEKLDILVGAVSVKGWSKEYDRERLFYVKGGKCYTIEHTENTFDGWWHTGSSIRWQFHPAVNGAAHMPGTFQRIHFDKGDDKFGFYDKPLSNVFGCNIPKTIQHFFPIEISSPLSNSPNSNIVQSEVASHVIYAQQRYGSSNAIVGYATNSHGLLIVLFDPKEAKISHFDSTNTISRATAMSSGQTDINWPSEQLSGLEIKAIPFVCSNTLEPISNIKKQKRVEWDGFLNVTISNEPSPLDRTLFYPTTGGDPSGKKWFAQVGAIGEYMGSLVIGGYQVIRLRYKAGNVYHPTIEGNELDHFTYLPHYVAFSDVDNPHVVGDFANIRVGASPAEPVTALGKIAVGTDVQGLRAQLAIFTNLNTFIYDGFPPQSVDEGADDISAGIDRSGSFKQSIAFGIGCISPDSVVETDKGLIFLGSNGLVYLIAGQAGPVVIGNAVEPALRQYTPMQLEVATAIYKEGFYRLSVPDNEENADPIIVTIPILHSYKPKPGPGEIYENEVYGVKSGTTILHPRYSHDNKVQYWADLRFINSGDTDLGVKWFGPHKGQEISNFAIGQGELDTNTPYGSVTNTKTIIQLDREDTATDYANCTFGDDEIVDPVPGNPIKVLAVSPEVDAGDAHIDKFYYGTEIGVGANQPVEIDVSVSILSGAGCEDTTISYIETVNTCGPVYGGNLNGTTFTGGLANNDPFNEDEGSTFELLDRRVEKRARGRVFRVHISEDSDAKVVFSDLTMKLRPSNRRG